MMLAGSTLAPAAPETGVPPVEAIPRSYNFAADILGRNIDRAGKGVYSPGLRDDAQTGRNALFSFIRETPGKEAFLALMDISRAHPAETARPWMAFHAKEKATLDADAPAWS